MTSFPPLGVLLRSSSVSAAIASLSGTVAAIGTRRVPCAHARASSSRSLALCWVINTWYGPGRTLLTNLPAEGTRSTTWPLDLSSIRAVFGGSVPTVSKTTSNFPFNVVGMESNSTTGATPRSPGVVSGTGAAAACHRGTVCQGDLGGGSADSAEAAVDEDRLPGLELAFVDQGLKGGGASGGDRGGLFEGEFRGLLRDPLLVGDDHLGEGTAGLDLRGAEHVVADGEPGHALADRLDDAGEVVAHAPWERAAGHDLHLAVADLPYGLAAAACTRTNTSPAPGRAGSKSS